jgi:DNA polymerase-3 subunit alpha
MRNLLYLDSETTGLDSRRHDIVQLACVPVINGTPQDPFNEFAKPNDFAIIEAEAIAVHGISIERMHSFQDQKQMLDKFIKYVKSFNVKFTIAGYNVAFDKGFISNLFAKHGMSSVYHELFTPDTHDVYRRIKAIKEKASLGSLKLSKACEMFQIEINAHDALSDISATINLDIKVSELLEDNTEHKEHSDNSDINFSEIAHIHLHSEYSNIDSIISIEDWVRWAIKNKTKYVSFPDHGWSVSLYKSLNTSSIIEKINKQDNSKHNHDCVTIIPSISINLTLDEPSNFFRLNAWAVSNKGYKNLLKLASLGWNRKSSDGDLYIPVLTLDEVERYSDGVTFGTGCDKGLLRHIDICNDYSQIESDFLRLHASLSGKILVEFLPIDIYKTYDHQIGFRSNKITNLMPDGNKAKLINNCLFYLVKKYNLKYIVSTVAHFIESKDKVLQDIVSRSSFKDGRYFYESRHQKSYSESYSVLKRHIGDGFTIEMMNKAISNSEEIGIKASSINIKHEYHLPKIDIPDYIKQKTEDYDLQLYYLLMTKIKEHNRWIDDPEYVSRFKKELDVIWKNERLNFIPYFLLYEDIGSFARSNGIIQNIGRGSAGGCLISYYLKIIHVDPVKEDIPFERFLSHARIRAGSFPDIDADYGSRAPILKYLKDKYNLGFAQIGTIQKFKTKYALKETMFAIYGRNRNDFEILDVCKTIPDSPQGIDESDFLYGYTDSEGEYQKGHLEQNSKLQAFFNQYPEAEKTVSRLIGLPKEIGRHASAFVISTLDLSHERVPTLQMADDELGDVTVTQFDAPMIEKLGLVKADILRVTTINTIKECVDLIKIRTNNDLLEEDTKGVQAIYRLPEDKMVFKDFYDRKTDSSFQFNTDLIKGYVKEFAPESIKDLSNLTALCRPGALDAAFLDTTAAQYYIDVRNGRRQLEYVHPDLEIILKKTNGVFVYQEDVMRFLVEFVGYSLEKSDQIRSAIAKKKRDVIMKTFEDVRASLKPKGWTDNQIETINQQILAFSSYSFNLSHSFCYGKLGYISMYLKHYFPLEWWSSELNNSGELKIRHYVTVLGNMITPPTLKHPSDKFTIVGDKIAAPLSVVKGVGASAIKELTAKGPFIDIDDYIGKVDHSKANAGIFIALVAARAADCFMDKDIDYISARKKLVEYYFKKRKTKKNIENPKTMLDVFLEEREINKCFNKTILSLPEIKSIAYDNWPALSSTESRAIPMRMGDVIVLGSVKVAKGLLQKQEGSEVGFIGLYEGSETKSGISKKTGKPWSNLTVRLSDGLASIDCVWWDRNKPLKYKTNSIIYVRGRLKTDWKGNPSIEILDIEKAIYNEK